MNINNPNDLFNFLVGNGIVGVCPEAQNLVACMESLARMCACDPAEAKQARYNQCQQHYVNFASRSQSLAHILLSKANENRIQFYLNNQMIAMITR
jgi:hypothetical protein